MRNVRLIDQKIGHFRGCWGWAAFTYRAVDRHPRSYQGSASASAMEIGIRLVRDNVEELCKKTD